VAARLRRDMPKQSGNIERKGAKGIARCEKMAFPGQIRSLVTRTWSAHYLQHSLNPPPGRACVQHMPDVEWQCLCPSPTIHALPHTYTYTNMHNGMH
jgi:hypothetical protein